MAAAAAITLGLQIAKALAPLGKAAMYYKANKQEKALREYTAQQGRMLSEGRGMSQAQLDAAGSQLAAQQGAQTQQALADVSRGSQGNAAQSGAAGQLRGQVYQQGQLGQAQAQTAAAKANTQAQAQLHQAYVQNLLTSSQMEYQRRQKAMGEMEKLNQQDVSDAFKTGQGMRVNMGETGQAGVTAGQAGAQQGMDAAAKAATQIPVG